MLEHRVNPLCIIEEMRSFEKYVRRATHILRVRIHAHSLNSYRNKEQYFFCRYNKVFIFPSKKKYFFSSLEEVSHMGDFSYGLILLEGNFVRRETIHGIVSQGVEEGRREGGRDTVGTFPRFGHKHSTKCWCP